MPVRPQTVRLQTVKLQGARLRPTTDAPATAPVKKATRKRTTKKAAAPEPELVTSDSPVTDGPVAAVDSPDQPQNETPAVTPEPRTRRRRPPTATVLFQAPIEVPSFEVPEQAAATSPVEATPEPVAEPERPSGRRTTHGGTFNDEHHQEAE